MQICRIFLRAFAQAMLYLSLVFQPAFFAFADHVPLCIDTPFNLETGEFEAPDPSLCGTGRRLGEGKEGADGTGSGYGPGEGAGDSAGGQAGSPSSSPDSSGSSGGLMDQSLGDWMRQNEQRTNDIRQMLQIGNQRRIAYINQRVVQAEREVKTEVTDSFIQTLERDFFSATNVDQDWLNRLNKTSKNIYKNVRSKMWEKVADLLYKHEEPFLKNYIWYMAEDIKDRVAYLVIDFKLKTLKKHKMRELGQFFLDPNNHSDWLNGVERIIGKVEQETNNALFSYFELDKTKYHSPDGPITEEVKAHRKERTTKFSKDIERSLYDTARRLAEQHIFGFFEKALDEDIQAVSQDIRDTVSSTQNINLGPLFQAKAHERYLATVNNVIKESLRARYDRKELAFFEDPDLTALEPYSYEFKSPEGEFLEKSKALYEKLYQSNPYHEQGLRARDIGLSAVETADEEFAKGNKESAELAYQIGEGMSDIALGVLPYVGLTKDVYEAFVGRHLLTGRSLSAFERSLSVAGILLSGITGGVLSAGVIKASFKNTGGVLGKINQKLLDKNLRGLSGVLFERIVKTYPQAVLNSLWDIGLKTAGGLRGGLKFLNRAFENPHVEDVTKTIRFVGKEGIEAYSKSIDKLSDLPIAGEEFLARSLARSGKLFSQKELMETGKLYTNFYKAMDGVQPVVVKERVWRALRKSGYNRSSGAFSNLPENLFRFRPAGRYISRRYSIPGEEALYTSLSRRTVINEVKAGVKGQKLTDRQVEQLFHIGSKNIEVDKVLDLTDESVKKLFKVGKESLKKKNIATKIEDNPNAYEFTHIIGHIAKRKGFKAIKAPSAHGGDNVISFRELIK